MTRSSNEGHSVGGIESIGFITTGTVVRAAADEHLVPDMNDLDASQIEGSDPGAEDAQHRPALGPRSWQAIGLGGVVSSADHRPNDRHAILRHPRHAVWRMSPQTVDVTTVKPGQLAVMAQSSAVPSPALRATMERTATRGR